jgi:hypothetical protein
MSGLWQYSAKIIGLAWIGLCGVAQVAAQPNTYTNAPSGAQRQGQAGELPGRVGRVAEVQGRVWLFDTEQGQWVDAQRNRALTAGDRLSTENGSRAELRIGSTELRVGPRTEFEFTRLDDDRMVFTLQTGTLALRVKSREIADEIEVRTAEGRVVPERSGHYRIDREDDTTYLSAWRGSLRFDGRETQVLVPAGRRAEFFEQRPDRTVVVSWSNLAADSFADWVVRDEQRDERSASQRYVSPEMTGAEDLDRHGRWQRHPDFGMVWSPFNVTVGWAPFRHGRWYWHLRWGWTWHDEAAWGFAPFHYGRWVNWGGRWCWAPGSYVLRPAFAPALVAWVGGSNASVSISIGGGGSGGYGPMVGWVPLAPREIYVPAFGYGPRYFDHVNRPHRPYPNQPQHRPQVPTGPIMYGNKGVPGAVTVVPANVLAQRQPVAAAVVNDAAVQRAVNQGRFVHDMPAHQPPAPRAPSAVVAAPGGATPAQRPPEPSSMGPHGQRAGQGASDAPGATTATPATNAGRVIDLRQDRNEHRNDQRSDRPAAGFGPAVSTAPTRGATAPNAYPAPDRAPAATAAAAGPQRAPEPMIVRTAPNPSPAAAPQRPVQAQPQAQPQGQPALQQAQQAPQLKPAPAVQQRGDKRHDDAREEQRDGRARTPESRQGQRERSNSQ